MAYIKINQEIADASIRRILSKKTQRLQEKHLLKKKIKQLECEIEDLEWENKGIAEWRDVATKAIEKIKELNKEITRLQEAHDHQYKMAGLMLREAERMGNDLMETLDMLYLLREHVPLSFLNQFKLLLSKHGKDYDFR